MGLQRILLLDECNGLPLPNVISHKVKPSASVMEPYRYGEQEKAILSEEKEPCPSQHRSNNLGSETKGESMVKGIYADGLKF